MGAAKSSALGGVIHPPAVLADNVTEAALAAPSQVMWAHCQLCSTVWHYDFALPSNVETVVNSINGSFCPGCGAGVMHQHLCSEAARKEAIARR